MWDFEQNNEIHVVICMFDVHWSGIFRYDHYGFPRNLEEDTLLHVIGDVLWTDNNVIYDEK
jgi:hypothetical protein